MAKGSHRVWGGWETRVCHHCGRRITLNRDTAAHHHENGVAFSLCSEHLHLYGDVRAELYGDPDLELPDDLEHHPDQLTLEALDEPLVP